MENSVPPEVEEKTLLDNTAELTESSSEIIENSEEVETPSQITEETQVTANIESSPATSQAKPDPMSVEWISALTDFTNQLKETNRISQERELIIDRLHHENQQLKQGELQQALLPIFRDLIRFYDDLDSTIVNYSNNPALSHEKVLRDISCYEDMVIDILYRYGVEQIETKPNEDFNSKEHKAVATATTSFEEQNRKIAKIIREGFKTENKVIRNVEVEVYRYTAPMVEKTEEQGEKSLETPTETPTETIESEVK